MTSKCCDCIRYALNTAEWPNTCVCPDSGSFSEQRVTKVDLIPFVRHILSDLAQIDHVSVFPISVPLIRGSTDAKVITNNMCCLKEVFKYGFGLDLVGADVLSSRSVAMEARETVHSSFML